MSVTPLIAKKTPSEADWPFQTGDFVALNGGGEIKTVRECRHDKGKWLVVVDWDNKAGEPMWNEYYAPQLYKCPNEAEDTE